MSAQKRDVFDKKEFIKIANEYLDKFFKIGKSYNFKVSSTKLEVTEMKKSTAPEWFREWSDSFEKKNDARWDRQEEFNGEVRSFMKRTDERLDRIESCPTIAKELKENSL